MKRPLTLVKMIENKYSPSFAHVQAAAVRVLWADRGVKGYENNTLMTEVHPLIRTWKIGNWFCGHAL